jgi:hypothetical protein
MSGTPYTPVAKNAGTLVGAYQSGLPATTNNDSNQGGFAGLTYKITKAQLYELQTIQNSFLKKVHITVNLHNT